MTATVTATRCSMMALLAALVLPACAASDDMDDVSSAESAMTSSDFLAQATIVGSLAYGETSATISYRNPTRLRAFKFAGDAGDHVIVDVKSANGGDAIAWVLDNDFVTIATNDDAAAGVLDAHIDVTLPANASRTHYIVFRDYAYKSHKFVVSLTGTADVTSCTQDTDCERVLAGCCPIGGYTAIRVGAEQAYHDSLACPAHQMCPMVMPRQTDDVAQCNNTSHQCELVDPLAITCGGFVRNMHECPEGYVCEGAGLRTDRPGACRKPCAGFGGVACDNGAICVDDPTDDCTAENGGRDCAGICQPKTCGGFGHLSCPDQMVCIDDPNDGCDEQNGGRDCGSICANL